MTPAHQLVQLLGRGGPIPAELVEQCDPFDLAAMVLRVLAWPPVPGAGEVLEVTNGTTSTAMAGGAVDPAPAAFVAAVVREDPDALRLAGRVNVLALGLLVWQVATWPPLREAARWLEAYSLASREEP